jgi:2'-5' RNA ligase
MDKKRLFIAVDVPNETKKRIEDLVCDWQKWLPLKAFNPDNLHLTILFLGNVPIQDIGAIKECLGNISKTCEPFKLYFQEIEAGPNPLWPRLIWLTFIKSDSLTKIKQALRGCIVKKLPYLAAQVGTRDSSAHLTLVRFQRGRKIASKQLAKITQKFSGELEVADLSLYQSQLTPKGPIYKINSKFKLQNAK